MLHLSRPIVRFALPPFAVALALAAAHPSPAAAKTVALEPSAAKRGVVTFDLSGLDGRQVTAAALKSRRGGRARVHRRLNVGDVRRAVRRGHVRIRQPRVADRSRTSGARVRAKSLTLVLSVLPAGAKRSIFRPVSVRRGVLTFRIRGLDAQRVKAASLTSHRGRKRVYQRLNVRKVRQAVRRGRLRVRQPRIRLGIRSSARAAHHGKGKHRLQVITTPPPDESTDTTTDTSTPAAGDLCSSTLGSFGIGSWPGGCWRPYASTSPFNRPLPASPQLHPNSSAIVSRLMGFGSVQHLTAGTADTADDWGTPVYYSSPTDPEFTLHCYENWGTCSIEGHKIRIPDAARASAGGDGHITVVDQASGWEYDLYKVRTKPKGGGVLEFRWGGRTRIDGDGLASDATAARYGRLGGIIRAQELEAGSIEHALYMVAYCDSGRYVYPAMKTGRSCSSIGLSNADAPPMGTRFQLAMSEPQIDALAVPAWKKTILRAMARYGLYFGDTGSGSWAIQTESGSSYTSFGHEDRLVTFAKQAGVPAYDGKHVFNIRDGVDWSRYLRVVDPCVSQGTC